MRVIYARGHTLGGLLIRHHDDGSARRWSHCGLIDGEVVWEALWPGGVRATPLAEFGARYSRTEVVEYDVPDAAAALSAVRELDGAPYPWATVLARLVGVHLDQPGPQCAELVEIALAAGGLRRWRGPAHLASPNRAFDNLMGAQA